MKRIFRFPWVIVIAGLLAIMSAGHVSADPQSLYVENQDGECASLVDNLIDSQPIQVWVKESTLDMIEVTDNGVLIDSDWVHNDLGCGQGKGKSANSVEYQGYLVCAELGHKENGNPQSYSVSGFLSGANVGTDSFRYDGFDFTGNDDLNQCCIDITGDGSYFWNGFACDNL